MSYTKRTYGSRSKTHKTAVGRRLLSIMESKQSNLCISVDLTSPNQILSLIDQLGPKICLVKTHIDIIDFSTITISTFTNALTDLSAKHDFLLFEDRKFADIGSTVQHQYRSGVYNIASWAHITNAHSVPGEGIIQGLRSVAQEYAPQERGLLMLAEMSSKGNLGGGDYLLKTVEMARRHMDFVMGFIAQGAVGDAEDEDFITMSPGISLHSSGDTLGQQYNTPSHAITTKKSDVIIVGRGVIASPDPVVEAERYRAAGWEAYQERVEA